MLKTHSNGSAAKYRRSRRRESGQVLLLGVVMMTMLLLLILYAFDIHNLIRAKFKAETAQQAAALAGADWQRESLNLIGELNLVKVCETLMTGDDKWEEPLPEVTDHESRMKYLEVLRGRIDLLTEMQTRISFIGPLIGFAAAQQAAKANGLSPIGNSGDDYLWLLENDYRYREVFGGAPEIINHYRWREPYLALLKTLIGSGIAVYPNAKLAGNPTVDPSELASEDLYEAIRRHQKEIAAGDPPEQSTWKDKLYNFVKYWRDSDFSGKFWNIDYTLTAFPGESEIFTLGLRTRESRYSPVSAASDESNFQLQEQVEERGGSFWIDRPVAPEFFCYDDSWYPDFYRSRYDAYENSHYNYWFHGEVLRRNIRSEYRYEGPAAYVEGAVRVGQTVRHRPRSNFRNRGGFLRDRGYSERERLIGSKRNFSAGGDDSRSTSYRPGVIAKTLGSLADGNAPIAVPVVLPVFDRITLMPTYMPIPYGFGVLRPGNSRLDRFLAWLAVQDDLFTGNSMPPEGTDDYLAALQHLVKGREFRYYGWNPDFDAEAFNEEWVKKLGAWHTRKKSYVYSMKKPDGPGWLQEPRLFYAAFANGRNDREEREVKVEDRINGGTATRCYVDFDRYYVINGKGKIVTNDEIDPTLSYNKHFGGGGGGGSSWHSGSVDNTPGPPRM